MAIAMVAMLAFGGTYAYFTATATERSGSVTTGVIRLKSGGSVNSSTTAVYGDVIVKEISFDNSDTTVQSYIFVTVTSEGATNLQALCGVQAEDAEETTESEDEG